MKIVKRDEWIVDPELNRWRFKDPLPDRGCRCGNKDKHIELIDHSSCIRGRIDTTICTACNEIVSFDIVR